MANIIKQGFVTKYEIREISSIKVTESGEYEGKKYSGSVQFKSQITEQIENEYGLTDKENVFIFRINSDDTDLKIFNTWLRSLDLHAKPLVLSCSLPILQGKDTYTLTSLLNSKEVMQMNANSKEK